MKLNNTFKVNIENTNLKTIGIKQFEIKDVIINKSIHTYIMNKNLNSYLIGI